MIRRRSWNPQYWKSEVLARLKEPGCPVSTYHSKDVVRDFFWFVNEHYYEAETIVDLRRSHGFCPVHMGYLLQTGATSVMTTVFFYLTEAVSARFQEAHTFLSHATDRQNPRDHCRQAAEILHPQGICRACRGAQWWESHIITLLLQTLSDAEIQTAYRESSGFCLPHFRKGGLLADWESLSFLSAGMCRRLMAIGNPNSPSNELVEQVAGLDRERPLCMKNHPRRTSNLPAHTKGQSIITLSHEAEARTISWSATFKQALAALAEPGCPVCNACAQGVQQYLDWLAREMEAQTSVSGSWDLSWHVCPSHLWDLYVAGHERAAALMAKRIIQEWLWKLDGLSAGLAKRPAKQWHQRFRQGFLLWCRGWEADGARSSERHESRWTKVAAVLESPRHRLQGLRTVAFREYSCQACSHIRETTRRTLDLILRVVEDPAGKQAYHQGWGLCLRHCITAASVAENPAALSELLKAQITHLRLLEWELEEASRKVNWSVRYEPKGTEQSAWRRAAYQFCGSTLWDS